MKGLLVKFHDGDVLNVDQVDVPDGRLGRSHETLRAMYEMLDCHTVDAVRLAPDLTMWVDDEGMYGGRVNPVATVIAYRHGFNQQPYYGNVLFLGGADAQGYTRGLTDDRLATLMDAMPH